MRAVVHDRYGPPEVQRLEEVEQPVPAEGEVLVKVHATTVNRTDCGFRQATPFFSRAFTGLRKPRHQILGMELAGEVEAVGSAVTEFAVGDHVFGVKSSGAHAEYVCVRESGGLAHMPAGITFEDAAAVCDGSSIALAALKTADLRPGRSILVYGASGSIGTAAVQLARHSGAHVAAVCTTKNLELVRSLGADEVIDYLQDDFTKNGEAWWHRTAQFADTVDRRRCLPWLGARVNALEHGSVSPYSGSAFTLATWQREGHRFRGSSLPRGSETASVTATEPWNPGSAGTPPSPRPRRTRVPWPSHPCPRRCRARRRRRTSGGSECHRRGLRHPGSPRRCA